MKCPKCTQPLPQDSPFCQFCGHKLEGESGPVQQKLPTAPPPMPEDLPIPPPPPEEEAPPPLPVRPRIYTGYTDAPPAADLPSAMPAERPGPALQNEAEQKPAKPEKKKNLPVILLAAVCLLLGLLLVVQSGRLAAVQAQTDERPDSSKAVEEQPVGNGLELYLQKQESMRDAQNVMVSHFLTEEDCGRASDDFYADKPVLYLERDETAQLQVTVKTKDPQLNWSISNDRIAISSVDWKEDTAKVTFLAKRSGITTVTFTADKDAGSFRVMVVVEE